LSLAGHLLGAGFWHTLGQGADGRSPIHAAPLMGPLSVVALKLFIEHRLRLLNSLESSAPPLNPEMLIKQGAVEAFKDSIGLRAAGSSALIFMWKTPFTPTQCLGRTSPSGPPASNQAGPLLAMTTARTGQM
jgi:hypothetical protein